MRLISVVLFAALAALDANAADVQRAKLIAHRGSLDNKDGARYRPENSLAAFEDAVANGFGFECDVVYTKDRRVFTMHDGCFRRCFGIQSENFAAMTWRDVSNLVYRTGREKKVRHPYTRVALFEEVCALARDGRWIFVEVKTGPKIVPLISDILARQKTATPRNLAFISFNSATIRALKRACPDYKAHLLLGKNFWRTDDGKWVTHQPYLTAEECIRRLKDCHADGLDFQFDPKVAEQGAAFVRAIKAAGFDFHYYCVDNREDVVEALRRGAETVTSNRPVPIVGCERHSTPVVTEPVAADAPASGTGSLPDGKGLADRFVAAARAAYVRPEYAAYTNTLLTAPAFRKWRGRADLPSGGAVRWVDVGGTANFRDLGGWNGLNTNLVFRGAEPNCQPPEVAKRGQYGYHNLSLTPAGERTLSRALAIRTDLDLRGRKESPTPDETPISSAQLLRIPCGSYTNFLAGTQTVAKILRVFANRANYPVYFHCYGGADRTGSVAFLLEGLCGVNETDLSIDYELTSFSRIGRRARHDRPYYYASMLRALKKRPGASLREKFEHYATVECGLTRDEVAAIRRILCGGETENEE